MILICILLAIMLILILPWPLKEPAGAIRLGLWCVAVILWILWCFVIRLPAGGG
jgi:hypothetical protein